MGPFALFLALGMLITGSLNTLTTKEADNLTSTDRYGNVVAFSHPFVQAVGMFIGEFLCLIVFYALVLRASRAAPGSEASKLARAKPFNPAIFILPALCDMTATSCMYVGLALTDASIFQMLRGSVIIFTAALSVLFLKRRLVASHYLGIFLVIVGTVCVGLQSKVCPAAAGATCSAPASALNMSTVGNILIIAAQLIVAVQMVVEEKFITGYDVPALQVVGLEGLFGFIFLTLILTVMYFVPPPAFLVPSCLVVNGDNIPTPDEYKKHFEDPIDAFTMFGNNPRILLAVLGNILSIAFFNYFGVSVTKHMSASSRMILDSLRTVVIWAFSLGVKWETFCYIEIIGFVFLITGTIVYQDVHPRLRIPFVAYPAKATSDLDDAAADLAKLAAADSEDMQAGLLSYTEAGVADSSINAAPAKGRK